MSGPAMATSNSSRTLGGLAGPTDCLQMGLRDFIFVKLAIEDPLENLLGLPEFLLFLGKAGIGKGAVGVAAFLQL